MGAALLVSGCSGAIGLAILQAQLTVHGLWSPAVLHVSQAHFHTNGSEGAIHIITCLN